MTKAYERLCDCVTHIRKKTDFVPQVALVLGSGLGAFADNIQKECVIAYTGIPQMPVSTNQMHAGRFVMGYLGDIPVIAMEGRIHYYEGYTMEQVVMPIRIMKLLGATTLILTNAAGGIQESFRPGNLMAITDHITSFIPSPLIGENIGELGTRFPDMTHVYDPELTALMKSCAARLQIDLKDGVYLQTTGPNYETPAEIRAFRALGADAVGMSTACEAMAAVQCGMKVCGISCITNMAAGMSGQPLDDKEVGEVAATVSVQFASLLKSLIADMKFII